MPENREQGIVIVNGVDYDFNLEVIPTITRQEAIKRLEDLEREIAELKKALEEGWDETPTKDLTQIFLDKCGGWEDKRSPEEIIADIYASRTTSHRDKTFFNEGSL